MSAIHASLFPKLPVEIEPHVISFLDHCSLVSSGRVNKAWKGNQERNLELKKRQRDLVQCKNERWSLLREKERSEAQSELNRLNEKVDSRAKIVTCASKILWPCTIPITCGVTLIYCLICPCIAAVFPYPCNSGACPVLNPSTPSDMSYGNTKEDICLTKSENEKKSRFRTTNQISFMNFGHFFVDGTIDEAGASLA